MKILDGKPYSIVKYFHRKLVENSNLGTCIRLASNNFKKKYFGKPCLYFGYVMNIDKYAELLHPALMFCHRQWADFVIIIFS